MLLERATLERFEVDLVPAQLLLEQCHFRGVLPADVCPPLRDHQRVPPRGFERQVQGREIRTTAVSSGSGEGVRIDA